jgi:hypothetical protein
MTTMAEFQRFKEGDKIPPARWYNDVASEVERLAEIKAIPPLTVAPGGPNGHPPIIGAGLLALPNGRIAKTGAGGIPAATGVPPTPGSATCTMYDFTPGSALSVSQTDRVYTITTAIAANTYIIVLKVQGFWFVVVEFC